MYGQVIGYAYEADVHCYGCAAKRFGGMLADVLVGQTVIDSEDNAVAPVLDGQDTNDLTDNMVCGDCFEILHEVG